MRAIFVACLLVFVLVAGVAAEGCDAGCKCTLGGKYYDLSTLKKSPAAAYAVYANDKRFSFNMCDGTASCGAQMGAVACRVPKDATMDDYTAIGNTKYTGQPLTPLDVADINWKTGHLPKFPPTTTGVKLVYPPFGGAPAAGGAGGYPASPAPPGWPAPPGPPPAPPGWPAPPPPAGVPPPAPPGWPAPPGTGPAPPPGWPAPPGQGAAPPPAPGKQSHLGLTVMNVCDKNLPSPVAMQFGLGQTYKDRNNGYLFVIASKEGCPSSAAYEIMGMQWGWIFVIIFCVLLVLYCGVGMFYKYKKLGVTGIETIPNVEFWRDYPSLVKDGIAFSISKVQACASRGGSGYSTV